MYEKYRYAKKKFEKQFFIYTNSKNKYIENKNFLNTNLSILYKRFYKNKHLSDIVLLKNINITFDEYYKEFYKELNLDCKFNKLQEKTEAFIKEILSIHNLYNSSRIKFIKNQRNTHLVHLTLKETLPEPIIYKNNVFVFKNDLDEFKRSDINE